MRMRKKKHGAERIAACSELLISDPCILHENPSAPFPAIRPLHLEIGCGKGSFACGMAKKYPDINFIAVERVSDVCCLALEKAKNEASERPADNLRFLISDAKMLAEYFPEHSLDCIYLNFSDPWPKSGHAKRRLTYRSFLEIYRDLLKPGGILKLKTDNDSLFASSLEEFGICGLTVQWMTDDLHHSDKAEDNIMTEYERNFSSKGMPIHSAWVSFN